MARPKALLPATGYDIGYGKPPKGTRFTAGTSGNPAGRPHGSKNRPKATGRRLNDLITKEAHRYVELNEQGSPVTLQMAQAVMRSVSVNAAKGKVGAQRLFFELVGSVEALNQREKQEMFEAAFEYKQRMTLEVRQAEARGEDVSDILPHPDHIELNTNTGDVFFHGPFSPEDKVDWDEQWSLLETYQAQTADCRVALARGKTEEDLVELHEELEFITFLLKLTALGIMRRWSLPAYDVVEGLILQNLLDQHVEEDTLPLRPSGLSSGRIDWEARYKHQQEQLVEFMTEWAGKPGVDE